MTVPLKERVRRRLVDDGSDVDSATVARAVLAETGGVLGAQELLATVSTVRQELVGAGPLDTLLRDERVTDVLVTGPESVWVDDGAGLRRSEVRFADDDAVRRLAQRLVALGGRRLDDAAPFADVWLPALGAHGPVRLHAVLSPVADPGTCLSLRVLRPAAHDLAALGELGTFEPEIGAVLKSIVDARLAFLVSGATGSGKTTLLAALLGAVDPAERIVCVEDAGELHPAHPQLLRLIARPSNVEGSGEVTIQQLVRQALRMRPDRLVIGEVRGAEVVDLLAALNTGHDGGAGTVHANAITEIPARLEALAALGGLNRAALHSQLAAAVRLVLHMRRDRTGARRLAAIGVLDRRSDLAVVRPVWTVGGGWDWAADLLRDQVEAAGVTWPG
ncbi:TadA family conjugal transfer-associated ATPase [Pseudonocardiaceae bacterium YIM PH 21723]|nr:TadA family conjugal transfer-associated ATPase [Pseudonocardiaceae bacterium YIM PH 21723]